MMMLSKDVNDKNKKGKDEMNGAIYSKRKTGIKVGLLFLGILVTAITLGISIYLMLTNYRETILAEQSNQMLSTAKAVSNSIEVYVKEYEKDLLAAVASPDFQKNESGMDSPEKNPMQDWLEIQLDQRGGDLGMAEWQNADGAWIRAGEMDYEIIKFLTYNKAELVIAIVKANSGDFFLKMSQQTATGGRLSYYIDVKRLYEKTASYIRMGEKGYTMIKASDGTILMHPVEEQIGIDVIDDRQLQYPDFDLTELENMIQHQLSGEEGVETYTSYWWADDPPTPVKKISAYTPAQIGNDFLVISTVIDYSELSKPINSGAMEILIVTGVLGTLLIVLFIYLLLMLRSQHRYEQENAYLKQVNEQLEELRKREEHLAHQQRLQLIGTMTGGIAHEFNNLLTPIMGYSAMLLAETDDDDSAKEDLQAIYDSAEKAKEIIDQISQFSGKNAEKTFRSLPLTSVIDKAMVMVESVKPKKVKLEKNLSDVPCTILGNPTQINQIILNLCNNAFHAMKEKEEGVLCLESQVMQPLKKQHPFFKGKEKEYFYRLSIRDNGCGMSPDTLEQIFVPFFTTKKAGEGTGLGLSIVQRIIEAHGGLLCVTSKEGEGSEFIIYLPVE